MVISFFDPEKSLTHNKSAAYHTRESWRGRAP